MQIGRNGLRHQHASKVVDRRGCHNIDDTVEVGMRNIRLAMHRQPRDGVADELAVTGSMRRSAENGWLGAVIRSERRDTGKNLLLLDVRGSLNAYVRLVNQLFSAARTEFRAPGTVLLQ